jgi:hypothetical protein
MGVYLAYGYFVLLPSGQKLAPHGRREDSYRSALAAAPQWKWPARQGHQKKSAAAMPRSPSFKIVAGIAPQSLVVV